MPRLVMACVIAAAVCAGPHAAWAQTWPSRPIAIVIPFPPGPGLDFIARLVGDKLATALGQPVIFENRTGANGRLASEYVARAAPDGHTLMAAATSTHATNVHLSKNLSYDPVTGFTPIIASVETIGALVVNTNVVPVASVAELIDYAKKSPGKLSYGTSGVGSFFHLAGELFNQKAGVSLAHVPYRGSAAAVTDLIGGHVPINFTQLAQALALADKKEIKILAVLETTRFSRTPELPSITETLPAYRMPASWNGFVGPAALPEPIVARLNAEIGKALNTPDVRGKIEDAGYRVAGGTPAQFGQRIRDDIAFYGPIIKAVGIQPE